MEEVIEMINKLERGLKIPGLEFQRISEIALKRKVTVSNCVPCIKAIVKELKSWVLQQNLEKQKALLIEIEEEEKKKQFLVDKEKRPRINKK